MSWNYRVVKRKYPNITDDRNKIYYEIHETYYDEKSKPNGITVNPQLGPAENLKELEWDLIHMLKAVRRVKKKKDRILKYEKF